MSRFSKREYDSRVIAFNIMAYAFVLAAVIFCVFPIILIVSGSFTDNKELLANGYALLPQQFSLEAYQQLFRYPEDIIRAYISTIFVTVTGTAAGLFFISMTGYVLQRKDFRYRNTISFLIYFTSIFGGGMVPWYIMLSRVLHLQNTIMARIFPGLMTSFLIILMRTFIQNSVPNAIVESGKIDGAGDFTIYLKLVLPVIAPGLATVGLFLALGYWNEWYVTSLFISKKELYSLQYFLYDMVNSQKMAQELAARGGVSVADVPGESVKMAMVVVATGPIIFLYPFVQRYFVSGITIGAVKG